MRAMTDRVRTTVRKRLDELGLNRAEVSKRLGKNHAYIQQFLERNVPQRLPEDVRQGLAGILGIPEDALRIDPVKAPANTPQNRNDAAGPSLEARVNVPAIMSMPKDVPVWGVAVGGSGGEFNFNGETIDYVRRPPGIADAKEVFALYVSSSSMSPRYDPGDLVFINPNRPPRIGDDVVIELVGEDGAAGGCYIKRLVRRTASQIVAAQFNPPRDDLVFEVAQVRRVYRILTPAELLGI